MDNETNMTIKRELLLKKENIDMGYEEYEDDAGELDMTRIKSKVWLVKVPKFLLDRWELVKEDGVDLGIIRIQNNKSDNIKLIIPDIEGNKDLPLEYNVFVMNRHTRNTYVFAERDIKSGQNLSNTSFFPKIYYEKGFHPYKPTQKNIALVGTIAHECNISPIINEQYRKVMQARSRAASEPKRKIQMLNTHNSLTGNFMTLGTPETNAGRFSTFIKNTKQKNASDQKASRLPRNELLDILFKCFDDYDYYSMKTLKEITKQPETYLKEVLESIAVLLKKGPYIMKWTLKTEYKNRNYLSSKGQKGPDSIYPKMLTINDPYTRLKCLQRHLEMLELQETFIKDDQKSLKRELIRAQEEVKRIQSVPLVIGQFLEAIDENTAIVGSTTGSNYIVRILSTLDRELLRPFSSVALHRHSSALVDILPPEADSSIAMLHPDEKPDVTYQDVGGLDMQKQEIREAVELPLTQADLYKQIGIDPPRGVLLYGPPGTGKTMLVKAVANSTTASFIRVVGSEFVQKYLGEGPRMVRDVFRLARENAPSIIFIDEIDAIATKRFDAQTGADREVQRILLELLNQMDGFDQGSNVKVIMATNRADTLDPALLRPGRLDRKIEFPKTDRRQKRLIYNTIAAKMSLSPEVDLDSFILRPGATSGAQIAAVMQEAGLIAVRKSRFSLDIEEAFRSQIQESDSEKFTFYT
ncbi:hypothetical protein PCK1_000406 [Pneumocystis canis]|nr:hypothetical protein PCK1_000406 [Pneumocystis canis]